MKRLWLLSLVLTLLLIPVRAGDVTAGETSETSSTEIVELVEGPTELDYLESINTYATYLFAFGVFWIILTVCSLVYKLLRIFI